MESVIKPTRVLRYDGQSICTNENGTDYELGAYLGKGAAGVVYEAECTKTKSNYAIKVLNPTGYKLYSASVIRQCEVAHKGQPYRQSDGPISEANVWWLFQPNNKTYIAAYYDQRLEQIKELNLVKCVAIWGLEPFNAEFFSSKKGHLKEKLIKANEKDNYKTNLPKLSPKYAAFLIARARIFREISSMRALSSHPNILGLHDALELIQDTNAIVFLVLELAQGGELFDRIKVDYGVGESTAKRYFKQILNGVKHCHDRGVCHRDLKPDNLLMADNSEHSLLKIADFGFSALFPPEEESREGGRMLKHLQSKVGSPYYVAPEVLGITNVTGYDGTKADVWSVGVILFAMVLGSLPFERELHLCSRFSKFSAWARSTGKAESLKAHCHLKSPTNVSEKCLYLDYPCFLFRRNITSAAKSLLCGLLQPDPKSRISIEEALNHPWVIAGNAEEEKSESFSDNFCEFDKCEFISVSSSSVGSYSDRMIDEEIYESKSVERSVSPKVQNFGRSDVRKNTKSCMTESSEAKSDENSASPKVQDSKGESFRKDPTDQKKEKDNFKSPPIEKPKKSRGKKEDNKPPIFKDHINKNSRFVTNMPVMDILEKIVAILNEDSNVVPYSNKKPTQKVTVNRKEFSVDVTKGGSLACTIQVYLMRRASASDRANGREVSFREDGSMRRGRGLYLVEFVRRQMDAVVYRRLYENVQRRMDPLLSRGIATNSQPNLQSD